MRREDIKRLAGEREKSIQKQILDLLALYGVEAVKIQNGMPGGRYSVGKKATPDIMGCLPGGRHLAIEVKKPGGVATNEQLERVDRLVTMGAVAFVTDSVDEVRQIVETEVRRWK
jgi:hypothetical protein